MGGCSWWFGLPFDFGALRLRSGRTDLVVLLSFDFGALRLGSGRTGLLLFVIPAQAGIQCL
jgi:hypothetical protein